MSPQKSLWARIGPYLYVTPTMLLVVAVFFYPVISLIQTSTMKKTGGQWTSVGLSNFRLATDDPVFWQAFGNNLRLLLAVPIFLFIALIISTLLFEQMRGWKFYRSIVFMPYILAVPVVGIVFTYLLGLRGGMNLILRSLGLGFLAKDWLGDSQIAIFTVMGIVIWKEVGFGIVLFLARLMSVDEELYEAARLDGANWWQLLWYVTVPQLSTVIEFYVIINVINMISWMFNYVYVMTRGGPGTSTFVLDFLIYIKAFKYSQPGIASAISLLLLAIAISLVVIQAFARRRLEEMQ
jgi:ABC-type sugar transport system permease subunit